MSELYHHGVKGMHWGVRRYQNYNGRYTQAGLERYKESVSDYNKHKQKYKEMKKEGGHTSHELKVQAAKAKASKRQADRRYNLLKYDKLADKGKIRYDEGERIRERGKINRTLGSAAGWTVSAGALIYQYPQVANAGLQAASSILTGGRVKISAVDTATMERTGLAIAGVGTVGGMAVAGKQMVDARKNREISAYYRHRYAR